MDRQPVTRLGALVVLALTLCVSGCASMSADECVASDWHTIGFEDGSRGYTATRLGDHRKACAKHGIAPDFVAYRAGHEEGVRDFCRPSRGFRLGSGGGNYNGVCSTDLEPAFLDAYNSGYHLYNLRSRVDSATHQIGTRENELEAVKVRIRETEAALISRETTMEARVLLLADLKELSERTGELQAEIDLLHEDRVRHEIELASYEAVLADSGY
jgi:hypothetical protein